MSIKSYAFGRVSLTGEDAKKFKNQVVYGKPKKEAVEAVKRGVALSRAFKQSGSVTLDLKQAKARSVPD